MSLATYWQRGESLDYVNETSVTLEAGTIVVLGTRIGVIAAPIRASETGSVAVIGVFEMPKTGTTAITMGEAVYFDGTGITKTATGNTAAGYAAQAAAASDTTVYVKLLG